MHASGIIRIGECEVPWSRELTGEFIDVEVPFDTVARNRDRIGNIEITVDQDDLLVRKTMWMQGLRPRAAKDETEGSTRVCIAFEVSRRY